MTPEEIVGIFADPLFDRHDVAGARRHELTYRRLRHVHDRLDVTGPLLDRPRELAALLETTAQVDPPLFQVMFLHHCMTVGGVRDFGGAAHDLDDLVRGTTIGAALMTELGHGNSIPNIRTLAEHDPDGHGFVLHSPDADAAKFPPNVGLPGVPRTALVGARLIVAGEDRGVFLFAVALRDATGPAPGVVIRPLPDTTAHALDYATVRFDRVRIPSSGWLRDRARISADGVPHDPLGDAAARTRRTASLSRFACGAVSLGHAAVARAAVAIAVTHAGRRMSTDRSGVSRPVIEFRNQQRSLFGAAARAYAATALARRVTDRCWAPAAPGAAATREFGLAKVGANRLAERAVAQCRTATGALGFLSVNRLIDYQGFTLAFNSAGGDNQMILLDAARGLVTGDDGPPPPARPDLAATGRAGWVDLLRAREHLLRTELRGHLTATGEPAEVWNRRADLAQRLAEAHLAAATLDAALAGTDDPVAAHLCRLFLLEEVSADAGWFLAAGLLGADDVRALPDHLDDASARLLPHVGDLLDLFAVPLPVVRASIAGDGYVDRLTR